MIARSARTQATVTEIGARKKRGFTSHRPPKGPTARLITSLLEATDLPQVEIAKALGYEKPNMLTMLRMGDAKLPLDKVAPLAKIVGYDPVHLMRVSLSEYSPETLNAIEMLVGNRAITDHEYEILNLIRSTTDQDPVPTTDTQRDALRRWAKSLL